MGSEGVVGAAQNKSVQPSPVGGKEPLQHIYGPPGVYFAGFHDLHQPGGGNLVNIAGHVVAVQQPGELFLGQCHGRRHNTDTAAGISVCRQLQGRLNAHNNEIGVFFPQLLYGGGGGGVAGDNQSLQPTGHELFRHRKAQRLDLGPGADAIGRIGGIAVI